MDSRITLATACILVIYAIYKLYQCFKQRRLPILGKSVFITGCDSGIGYALCRRLDLIGFRVFAGCLFPDGPGANELRNDCSNRVAIVLLDITQDDTISNAVETVKLELNKNDQKLWALINNAGVCILGNLDWLTPSHITQQIQVNLIGTIKVTKAFLPLLKESKGRCITVTSVNGFVAYPALSVYCATKFGLEGFCDSLRRELSSDGVSVSIIEPGDISAITNIVGSQSQYSGEMWASFDTAKQQRLSRIFNGFNSAIEEQKGSTAMESVVGFDAILIAFELALLSCDPKARYFCGGLGYKCVLGLLYYLPTNLSDWVISSVFELMLNKAVKGTNKNK